MDDKVLIVKLKVMAPKEVYIQLLKDIRCQMETGLVLLPECCDAIVVPKDIEVKIENACEARDNEEQPS